MPNLDRILESADERVVAKEVELRVDMALKRFPVPSPVVASYPEAEKLAADFYRFAMKDMFGATISEQYARGFVSLLVKQVYPAGIADAADISMTGIQGGVLNLLQKIGDSIKKQLVNQWISGAISEGVDLSSWDERVKLMETYLSRFGGNVPSNSIRRTAQELAGNAEEVIQNHLQIVSFFRRGLSR